MKLKRLLATTLTALTLATAVGCKKDDGKTITVWVGGESVKYYEKVLADYKKDNDFPLNFKVVGADAGKAADNFLQDVDNGADILTVAHDNIAKLTVDGSHIMPLTDQSLIDQVKADNTEEFVSVITKTMQTSNGAKDYMFAVPYITQSLVLYYNNEFVSEEQAKTWEGIAEAAKAVSKTTKACTLVGEDGYNFSWSILARQMPNNTTTLKLYEDKKAENCYFQGDDMVAVTKWTQDYFKNPNGFMFPTSSGWELELSPKGKDTVVLSVITGAWDYDAVKEVLGSNLGVAKLPTFTTTEEMGTIPAGTEFQSGSFYDCKAFVMKKKSPHAQYLQEIVKYLSSKEIQEGSFEECNNLPAYKNAKEEFEALSQDTIEAKVANIQYEMSKYGIAQPFGTGDDFTRFYYTSGAGITYKELIIDVDGSLSTYNQIKSELTNIENIWKTGEQIR